jgi:hypothetical protein
VVARAGNRAPCARASITTSARRPCPPWEPLTRRCGPLRRSPRGRRRCRAPHHG